MTLCNECYSENKYPLILSSKDFVKVDVTEKLKEEQEGY
jgi:hypothetical protein